MGGPAGGVAEPDDQDVAEQTTSSGIDEAHTDEPFGAGSDSSDGDGGGSQLGGEVLEPHELGQYGDPYQTGDPGRTT